MNIEELQAAVDWYDAHGTNLGTHVDNMAEAARLVANPNIEAAGKGLYDDFANDAAGDFMWPEWSDLDDEEAALWCKRAVPAVAAALTPGDTDEH